jgi:flagellar motor switch protein FliM
MADEPLSREELEALLDIAQARSAGDVMASRGSDAEPRQQTGAAQPGSADEVLSYEQGRPQRFDSAQLRTVAGVYEAVARGLTVSLSDLLRSKVKVKLAAVDEITFGEFHAALPEPTCLNVVRNAPLAGRMVVQLDHAAVFSIIDRLLGGGHEPAVIVRRPLTQIELRLMSRVVALLLDDFRKAWQTIVELQPTVELVEHQPQSVRILPEHEIVIVARLNVTLADVAGSIVMCLPLSSLRPIRELLASRGAPTPSHPESGGGYQPRVVELVAELAQTHVLPAELARLQVGDLIATDTDAQGAVSVRLDGVTRFRGRAGAAKGHKAVRVEDVIEFE